MKYFFAITLVLISFVVSFAQETTITKEKFDKVMANSNKVLMNSPNRTIEESEMQN